MGRGGVVVCAEEREKPAFAWAMVVADKEAIVFEGLLSVERLGIVGAFPGEGGQHIYQRHRSRVGS